MSTDTSPAVIEAPAEEAPLATQVPAILGEAMAVSPAELREALTAQVRRYVTEVRTARGRIDVPQDAFPLLRTLGGGAQALKHYGRVIRDLEQEVRAHVEDEAAEVAGEAEGIPVTRSWKGDVVPAANVTIPDGDGDWQITRDFDSSTWADLASLVSVQARLTAAHACAGLVEDVDGTEAFEDDEQERREAEVYALCQQAASDALERVLFLVSEPKPKSSALKAWGKELSRKGLDDLASIVAGAWRTTRSYRGVSVDRS